MQVEMINQINLQGKNLRGIRNKSFLESFGE